MLALQTQMDWMLTLTNETDRPSVEVSFFEDSQLPHLKESYGREHWNFRNEIPDFRASQGHSHQVDPTHFTYSELTVEQHKDLFHLGYSTVARRTNRFCQYQEEQDDIADGKQCIPLLCALWEKNIHEHRSSKGTTSTGDTTRIRHKFFFQLKKNKWAYTSSTQPTNRFSVFDTVPKELLKQIQ